MVLGNVAGTCVVVRGVLIVKWGDPTVDRSGPSHPPSFPNVNCTTGSPGSTHLVSLASCSDSKLSKYTLAESRSLQKCIMATYLHFGSLVGTGKPPTPNSITDNFHFLSIIFFIFMPKATNSPKRGKHAYRRQGKSLVYCMMLGIISCQVSRLRRLIR